MFVGHMQVTVFLFLTSVSLSLCLYSRGGSVVELTEKNFAEKVIASTQPWVVEFYAPWCGHCKTFAPQYEKAAANLLGLVPVGAVDCDQHRNICGAYEVKGFPTVKLFPSELVEDSTHKGSFTKKPIDYNGARSAAPLAKTATGLLTNKEVTTLSASNVDAFVDDKSLAKFILFSEKSQIPNMFKALSMEYKHRLKAGFVTSSKADLVSRFSITSFPSIIVITEDGNQETYSGPLKAVNISKFLSTFAKKPEQPGPEAGGSKKAKKEEKPRELLLEVSDNESLKKACYEQPRICAVALLDSEGAGAKEHKKTLSMLKKVAKKLESSYQVSWLDGAKHPEIADQLDIRSGYPSLTALVPRKKACGIMLGTFTETGIVEFLEKVKGGGGKRTLFILDKLPEFNEEEEGEAPSVPDVDDIEDN